MQVKTHIGIQICIRCNQIITIESRSILENKTLLCGKCIQDNEIIKNSALSKPQTKESIQENLTQINQGHDKNINLIQHHQMQQDEEFQKPIKQKINICIDEARKCLQEIEPDDLDYHKFQKMPQNDQTQQDINREQGPIICHLINCVKQEEDSQALAFNSSGSIMVAGFIRDIKVWQFEEGKMTYLSTLKCQGNWIRCLLFSKKYEWFISGDGLMISGNIKSWKKGNDNSEWLCNQTVKKHTSFITGLILTKNEDQLISCSEDRQIIVWKVEYETNQIEYEYSLENQHSSFIFGISLNQSENELVSCGDDKKVILWTKGQDDKWIYNSYVSFSNHVSRVCFIDQEQLLIQQHGKGFIDVYKVDNHELKKQEDLKIHLNVPDEDIDSIFFPTIYHQSKQIIIQKSHKYVYILGKSNNGSFKVETDPINCETHENFGNLTNDGQFLVIWNKKIKEFRIYRINYGG